MSEQLLAAKARQQICSPSTDWVRLKDIAKEADELRYASLQAAEESHRESRKTRSCQWKEFVRDSLDSGGGALHKWTKAPMAWLPTTTEDDEGALSAAPLQLLAVEPVKWQSVSKASDQQGPVAPPGERQALPRLSADAFRAAAEEFPEATASTVDGVHPRHLGMLCMEGLEATCALLEAVEVAGRMPPQLQLVTAALIAKPTGVQAHRHLPRAVPSLGQSSSFLVCRMGGQVPT